MHPMAPVANTPPLLSVICSRHLPCPVTLSECCAVESTEQHTEWSGQALCASSDRCKWLMFGSVVAPGAVTAVPV